MIEKIKLVEQEIIKQYQLHNGNIHICFSGGKDSTILRHIALRIYPNLPVVFFNTGNELKEIINYVKTFENVIWVYPKKSFVWVLENYGFPLVSKEVSQKVRELKYTNSEKLKAIRRFGYQNHPNSYTDGERPKKNSGKCPNKWQFLSEQKFDVTEKCCKILKKDPLDTWAKENNSKPLIAIMKDESSLRHQLSLYGSGTEKIYPFLNTGWTERDIWSYAKRYNIRFAECYYDQYIDGFILKAKKRTGCEYCGFGIHLEENSRFLRSAILSPKRHKKMMSIKNNEVTFSEAINLILKVDK